MEGEVVGSCWSLETVVAAAAAGHNATRLASCHRCRTEADSTTLSQVAGNVSLCSRVAMVFCAQTDAVWRWQTKMKCDVDLVWTQKLRELRTSGSLSLVYCALRNSPNPAAVVTLPCLGSYIGTTYCTVVHKVHSSCVRHQPISQEQPKSSSVL